MDIERNASDQKRSHKQSVLHALAQSNGERSIARYLQLNPILVLRAFGDFGNHGNYILAEFSLANKFRADFVILQGSSVGWEVEMIELEPVTDRLFNKNGTPTKLLRLAQKQISDWKEYARTDGNELRRQLAVAAKRDLLKFNGSEDPCTMSGQRLRDPESFVHYNYHIVIGRRDGMSQESQQSRSRGRDTDGIDIATYDRIVDVAAEFDAEGGCLSV